MNRKNRTAFIFFAGLIIGFLLNFIFNNYQKSNLAKILPLNIENEILVRKIGEVEPNKENNIIYTKCNYNNNGPRILCVVFTHSIAHSKLQYVHYTWGKRCNKIIYMTGPKQPEQNDDPQFNFVYLNMIDEYNRITEKALLTFEYIYDNLMEEFDWLVRANDDTYIIMENLRLFLANKCPDEKIIYGKILKYFRGSRLYKDGDNTKGFLQGGSGFLISRESLRLFVESMRKDPHFCVMLLGRLEDQEISNCFRKINIYPGETRDELGRERFFMDQFHQLWSQPSQDFLDYSLNPVKLGPDCCSNTGIGFHNIKNVEHFKMEYFLYGVHPKNYTFVRA